MHKLFLGLSVFGVALFQLSEPNAALAQAIPDRSAPQSAPVEIEIYPYAASENYCPAGLQPVALAGVISCGIPNQTVSYQQAKRHPGSTYSPRLRRRIECAGDPAYCG